MATRAVLRELRHPDFRAAAQARDEQGQVPVVVALEDDTVGYVFDRAKDLGGSCSLAVPTSYGTSYVDLKRQQGSAPVDAHQDRCVVHLDSEVGMLLDLLAETKQPLVLSLQPDTRLQLLDDGHRDPVDA
jgi:hypothetical protein